MRAGPARSQPKSAVPAPPRERPRRGAPGGDALLLVVALLLTLLGLGACADAELTAGERVPIFVLEVSGEEFRVQVTDPAEVAKLEARHAADQEGVVSGDLLPGDGGFNQPWSWHLDPTTVHVPDLSIELCDGRPSMVEEDLLYWLTNVGAYCPWGARVVRVIR